MNDAAANQPTTTHPSTVRIYRPTEDWAGLGYPHWMVVGIAPNGTTIEPPLSGVGRALATAFLDYRVQLANRHRTAMDAHAAAADAHILAEGHEDCFAHTCEEYEPLAESAAVATGLAQAASVAAGESDALTAFAGVDEGTESHDDIAGTHRAFAGLHMRATYVQ